MSEKKREVCSSCQSYGNNVVSMGCGHRLCINCLKAVKIPASSCVVCISSRSKKNRTSVSPQERRRETQSKTLKDKILDRVRSPSTAHQISQSSPDKTSRTYMGDGRGAMSVALLKVDPRASQASMQCRQHNEPLIMYCQRNKQFFCAQCLYLKGSRNMNTIPIKNAVDILTQENKINREQSRGNLSQIQAAIRVCSANRQLFQSAMCQYSQVITNEFEQIRKDLRKREQQVKANIEKLFSHRIEEYNKILTDLEFLRNSIRDYRQQNNKENGNLNSTIYLFSAYKIIRKAVKSIDFNYVQYGSADLSILDLEKKLIIDAVNNFGRVRGDLPLKIQDTSKVSRVGSLDKAKAKNSAMNMGMHAIRQENENSFVNLSGASRQPHQNISKQHKTPSTDARHPHHSSSNRKKQQRQDEPVQNHRKQQYSLSNNLYEPPEKNLYERLLNEKFNRYK